MFCEEAIQEVVMSRELMNNMQQQVVLSTHRDKIMHFQVAQLFKSKRNCMKAQVNHFFDICDMYQKVVHLKDNIHEFVGQMVGNIPVGDEEPIIQENKHEDQVEQIEASLPPPLVRPHRSSSLSEGNRRRIIKTRKAIITEIIWKLFRQQELNSHLCAKERIRIMLFDSMKVFLRRRMDLYSVGSTINGLGRGADCDLDTCLILYDKDGHVDERFLLKREALIMLDHLKVVLKKSILSVIIRELEVIPAKTPIIKFHFSINSEEIEVNMNINQIVSMRNTLLIKMYGQMDGRVRPFVIAVKKWAHDNGINDAFEGTLSSYSLCLMSIHFLQSTNPRVLPCIPTSIIERELTIQQINAHTIDDTLLDSFIANKLGKNVRQTMRKKSLGDLFLEFLSYYSNFNFHEHAISVRTGGVLNIDYYGGHNYHTHIYIEEPFNLTNTAHSVRYQHQFDLIVSKFKETHAWLRNSNDINKFLLK